MDEQAKANEDALEASLVGEKEAKDQCHGLLHVMGALLLHDQVNVFFHMNADVPNFADGIYSLPRYRIDFIFDCIAGLREIFRFGLFCDIA